MVWDIYLSLRLSQFSVSPLSSPCAARRGGKIPRIGYLDFRLSYLDAFRQGLRDLGYVEGRNIAIEYRSAEGDIDRLAPPAAEVVRRKVDVLVTSSGQVQYARKRRRTLSQLL